MSHVKAFLNAPLFYYKLMGLGLLDNSPSKYEKLQQIFFVLNLCNLALFLSSQIFATYKNPYNLINGSPVPLAFLYNVIFYGKLIMVLTKRTSLGRLVAEMNTIFPKSRKDELLYKLESYQQQLGVMVRVLMITGFGSIYLFCLAPLAQSFFDYYRFGRFSYHLPSVFWFDDFQDKCLLVYYITYLHQVYAIHICGVGIIAADLFLYHLIFLLTMFFDHVSNEFRTLNKDFREHLKATVEVHSKILWMSLTVNEVFGASIVLNLAMASFNLCMLGFRITSAINGLEFVGSLLLLGFQMIQIGCCCYLGTRLIESSTNVNISVYHIFPYCQDLECQRSLLFIMRRSQTPAVLNSSMLSSVSMETMRRVLSVAFQFFAVLNSVRRLG